MIRSGEEIIAAVIGGSKCGKTTLVSRGILPQLWHRHRLKCLVFDPWLKKYGNQWGPSAWVCDNIDVFKRVVFSTHGHAVVWDESTDSLNRHARDDKKFFTRIRHEHRAFFLIAHDLTVMDPTMRGNLSDLYIFAQGPKRAEKYAEEFIEPAFSEKVPHPLDPSRLVYALAALRKREFMHKRPFETARRYLPTLEQLPTMPLV